MLWLLWRGRESKRRRAEEGLNSRVLELRQNYVRRCLRRKPRGRNENTCRKLQKFVMMCAYDETMTKKGMKVKDSIATWGWAALLVWGVIRMWRLDSWRWQSYGRRNHALRFWRTPRVLMCLWRMSPAFTKHHGSSRLLAPVDAKPRQNRLLQHRRKQLAAQFVLYSIRPLLDRLSSMK